MDVNKISKMLQSKVRLAIVSSLITGEKTFNEIKESTKTSDGNLSTHLSKLEDAKFITVKKDFLNNKPRTRYDLTNMGRNEFENYVKMLEEILKLGNKRR